MLQNIHIKRFNVAQSNNAPTRNNLEKYSKGIFNNGWDICPLYIQNRLLSQILQTLSSCK